MEPTRSLPIDVGNVYDLVRCHVTNDPQATHITRDQDLALKCCARKQGLSEAEVVRTALDRHLRPEKSPSLSSVRAIALEALLAANKEIATHHRFPNGYRFDRKTLYAEREERWLKHTDGA